MSVDLFGLRLLLQVGSTVPLPAPFPVMDALRSLEVRSNGDSRDGFQLTLAIGKDTPLGASLLLNGLLEPPNRVAITLFVGAALEVLIDGVITHTETSFSPTPGESTLHVTGEDLSLVMDLEEQNRTFESRPDSAIVLELLKPYIARYALVPDVRTTTEIPLPTERMPSQQATDLEHIRHLARRNGFVFFIEPTAPGVSRAYFGPDAPAGAPQPAVNIGFSSQRAASSALRGSFDAMSAVNPSVSITDPITGTELSVPLPNLTAVPPVLQPASSLRTTITRSTSGLSAVRAILEGQAAASEGRNAVRLSGEIDGVRYGQVLRTRKLVKVSGAGAKWDGDYKVAEVTHHVKQGEYKQSFTLERSGFFSPPSLGAP